jgi:hypothetical protein
LLRICFLLFLLSGLLLILLLLILLLSRLLLLTLILCGSSRLLLRRLLSSGRLLLRRLLSSGRGCWCGLRCGCIWLCCWSDLLNIILFAFFVQTMFVSDDFHNCLNSK